MNDAALDRDLQALLGADPSPAFVTRVRTQIAADAATAHPWLASWTGVLAVAATVAVVIVALAGYRGGRGHVIGDRPPALATRPLPHSNTAAPVSSLVAGLEGRVSDRLPPQARPIVAARQAIVSNEPAVLVDPREAAALRVLIRRMRDGAIDLSPLLKSSSSSPSESPDVAGIEIPVITIEPITPGTGEEGVRK